MKTQFTGLNLAQNLTQFAKQTVIEPVQNQMLLTQSQISGFTTSVQNKFKGHVAQFQNTVHPYFKKATVLKNQAIEKNMHKELAIYGAVLFASNIVMYQIDPTSSELFTANTIAEVLTFLHIQLSCIASDEIEEISQKQNADAEQSLAKDIMGPLIASKELSWLAVYALSGLYLSIPACALTLTYSKWRKLL